MRTTLTIDDALFSQAAALAPTPLDKSELLRECVKAYIREQSALRLAALGGAIPQIQQARRRRTAAAQPR